MKKKYSPNEPDEDVLSAADIFQDAEQSEARWQAFEKDQKYVDSWSSCLSLHSQSWRRWPGRAGGLWLILWKRS